MPIEEIKIDKSFVQSDDLELLRIIVEVGKLYDLRVVAEGVETKEQLQTLRSFGVDLFQGYLFGKPHPTIQKEQTWDLSSLD